MKVVLGLTPEGLDACFDPAAQGDECILLKPLMLLFQNIVALQEIGPPQHLWDDLHTAAEMSFRCVSMPLILVTDACDVLANLPMA